MTIIYEIWNFAKVIWVIAVSTSDMMKNYVTCFTIKTSFIVPNLGTKKLSNLGHFFWVTYAVWTKDNTKTIRLVSITP